MLIAVFVALAGCGSSGRPVPAAATVATFTFRDGAIVPARLTVRRSGPSVRIVLDAADGRPHAVVARVGTRRLRIVVTPGATQSRTIPAPPQGRYRIVPDGAATPAVLIVR